jgi:hypothetical protein
MVAVPDPHIGSIRAALGPAADALHFKDMRQVGSNPARIPARGHAPG